MSEQTETAVTAGENEQGQEAAKSFEAITSQEDFDKAIQARIARERAKIPADYDDLKAKATEFEQWQESQKTEAQKAADRLAAAEKQVAEYQAKATRAEVAAAKGIPLDLLNLLTGSTPEELEASADALIKYRGDTGGNGLRIPSEGNSPAIQGTSEQQFAKTLFGRRD